MNNHHHLHRPVKLSLPPRFPSAKLYPYIPYSSSTPTPTPSKRRAPTFNFSSSSITFSSLVLLLLSLRSLYSILPFLRSSPSFSLFPLSFLVSLFSFFLSLSYSLFSPAKDFQSRTLTEISFPHLRLILFKSSLLSATYLLRFQSLRSCGTAATILAECSGNFVAKFITEKQSSGTTTNRIAKVSGLSSLLAGLFLLSNSWDRVNCFPFSSLSTGKFQISFFRDDCVRVSPMLLPFLCGFLGFYERNAANWVLLRQLGRRRVRLISLFFTTVVLFLLAALSFIITGQNGISVGEFGWPLVNIVVFGVILSENNGDEKLVNARDLERDFLVTFFCTVILELFYYPELSLMGLCLSGFLLWISIQKLGSSSSKYIDLGFATTDSFSSIIMNTMRHILSEKKSRKIALFLLINTGYMVVEFIAGFMSNSLGLISDACHMLFDCAALAIGLYASYISRLPASNEFNYGRGRFEVLSGYVNAVFLVLVGALIVLESIERILDPQEIETNSLLAVSIGGLLVNLVGLMFFHEEHHLAHGSSGACSHAHAHSHAHTLACHHEHDPQNEHSHEVAVQTDTFKCHHNHSCKKSHENSSEEKCLFHEHDHVEFHNVELSNDGYDLAPKHDAIHDVSRIKHENHHPSDRDSHDHCDKLVGVDEQGSHHCGHNHHSYDHHHHHEHDSLQDSNQCSMTETESFSSSGEDHLHNHPHSPKYLSQKGHSFSSQMSNLTPNELHERSHSHRHVDHNMEGIFLHVLADTMGSLGVVVSTLLIKYKGWLVADPACSIFISVMIILSVIPLLRNSAEILLQRVPRTHEHEIKMALKDVMHVKGVKSIHNVHLWSFTNTDIIGTLHLCMSPEFDKVSTKDQVSEILRLAGVKDITIQVEYSRKT